MKNRFDLESEINEVFYFSTHLKDLAANYSDNKLSEDELLNALIGLAVLIEVKTDKLYEVMCSVFGLNKGTQNPNQMDLNMAWDTDSDHLDN